MVFTGLRPEEQNVHAVGVSEVPIVPHIEHAAVEVCAKIKNVKSVFHDIPFWGLLRRANYA